MKKLLALLCTLAMVLSLGSALGDEAAAPKYVFMFIGDGMSDPQVTLTQDYLGSLEAGEGAAPAPSQLSFTQFPCLGLMTNYSSSSLITDSAAAVTAMASGKKTLSGVINYDETLTTPLKPITEYIHESGKKVGVITTMAVDHATPAGYYAKETSRHSPYNIALQALYGSTVDFLAGGGFTDPTDGGSKQHLLENAQERGWQLPATNEEIRALTASDARVLVLNPVLQDGKTLYHEIDRLALVSQGEDILSLADYVRSGIAALDGDNGFFMMVEGGKIDWAGHANDAAAVIHDVIALSDAVQVALDFAQERPGECLIIVTGDHETGGLTIGHAATRYDTHLTSLAQQQISYVQLSYFVSLQKDKGASFGTMMQVLEEYYGLSASPDHPTPLAAHEIELLETAWDLSNGVFSLSQEDTYRLYGKEDPFVTAVNHVMANRAGVSFTTFEHTGMKMPVYAWGKGAEAFSGLYDNTDIFHKTMQVMGLVETPVME